jgi:hypothetical protein
MTVQAVILRPIGRIVNSVPANADMGSDLTNMSAIITEPKLFVVCLMLNK